MIPLPSPTGRRWLLAGGAFAVVLLLVASPLLLGQVEPLWDASDYYYPAFAYFQAALREGRLPLWDPYTNCGLPFLTDPQNSYPPSPLAMLLALSVPRASLAFVLFWVLTWLWGGLGAARLSRTLGATPAGGFVAAVTYALSGYYLAHAEHTVFLVVLSWAPWATALAHEAVLREDRRRALLAGVCLGLSTGAGYPGMVIFEGIFLALWLGLAFLLPARLRVDDPRPLHRRAAWVAGVLAVGALVMAATWSPTLYIFFRDGHGYTDRVGVLARETATAVDAFPWPAASSLFFPQATLAARQHMGADVSMTNAYLGVLAVPLAALWFLRGGARRPWWLLAFVLLVAVVSLGAKAGLRGLLYDLLPPTRFTRHTAALRGFWMLPVAAAAGAGFSLARSGAAAQRALLRAALAWAVVAALAGVALQRWLSGLGVTRWHEPIYLPFAAGMAVVLVALLPGHRATPPVRAGILLAVLLADLGWHLRAQQLTVWIPAPGPIHRVESHPPRDVPFAPRRMAPLLGAMNAQQVVRIPVVQGYVPMSDAFFNGRLVRSRYAEVLAGPRFWLAPPAAPPPSAEIEAGVLASLGAGSAVPAFVEGMRAAGAAPVVPGSLGTVQVARYQAEAIDLAVRAPPGGPYLLASTERWAAGWRVFVDGQSAPVLQVNRSFRAVAVGAGEHLVSWRYDPGAYPLLLGLAWLVAAAGAVLGGWVAWRGRD